MMLHRGCFSLEVIEAVSRQKCYESVEPSSGETFVQVDPKAHYLVRLAVLGGGDPDAIYLAYVNVNDEYIGYRQCLSQRQGYQDVGVCSTMIGDNKPIRFQEAKLLETGSGGQFHSNILHMGKVTVKIYEGINDRRRSAFGNNLFGNEAFQPGRFIETMTIHCCATPEAGHAHLTMGDAERLKRALLKRPTERCEGPATANFKRVKTENGYLSVASNAGGGMDCDMVMHQQPWPLA